MFGGFIFGGAPVASTGGVYTPGAGGGEEPPPPPPPPQNTRVVADGAVGTDWDLQVDIGGDETGVASEAVVTTGLGVGSTTKVVGEIGTAVETVITSGLGPGGGGNPDPPPPPVAISNSVIRFVDSVGASAGLRMDLDGGYWRVLKEGTDTPPPPMEDQRVSSTMADGEMVTASSYRNRTIRLALLLDAPNQAVAYREIQALQRELDRPTNVLWYQPDDSQPAWYFRTYRGPDVTTDLDYGIVAYKFTLEIEAEPFALGDEIQAGTFTIPHNPAASPGLWFDINNVRGDVPTPLMLRTHTLALSGDTIALSTRRRGTPGALPIFRQAESLSSGTVVSATDSSNGSAARYTVGPSIATAFSGTFPAGTGSSVDWRGTYRVFARMRRTAEAGPILVQVGTRVAAPARNQQITVDFSEWVTYDLGLVQLPQGNAGRTAGYGAAYPAGFGSLFFLAQRPTGSSSLEVDYVIVLPADEDYALVTMPSFLGGLNTGVLDGPNGVTYGLGPSGELRQDQSVALPYIDGQLPTVSPGAATNRVYLVASIFPAGADEYPSMATTFTVSVSYWPRYLLVRPGQS